MSTVVSNRDDVQLTRLRLHLVAVREFWPYVVATKEALLNDDISYVAQLWSEIPKDRHAHLWSVSTRDGGIWTTKERAMIKQAQMMISEDI